MHKAFLGISIAAFVLSLGFRINSSNKLAVKNQELENMYNQKAALEKEIAFLEYEDSKYSSLRAIEMTAINQGFIKAQEKFITVDLTTLNSLAARQ